MLSDPLHVLLLVPELPEVVLPPESSDHEHVLELLEMVEDALKVRTLQAVELAGRAFRLEQVLVLDLEQIADLAEV